MTRSTQRVRRSRPSAVREFGASVATIMVKELRSRMRGRRAFIVLTVYLAILALITYGVYVVVAPSARGLAGGGFGGGQANASALIGQSIFTVLSIFQLILVCFIAPAFTAGQISMEREKQTLDLLVSTPMRPGAIVIGKLAAALAFVVLMIVAAMPITAIVLMYGGASVEDIVRQQVVLLATALVLGAIGLFFSALLKRTQAATVLTYISVLVLTLGTTMLFIFWTVVANQTEDGFGIGPQQRAPEQLMYVNPGIAMLDVVANTEPGGFGGDQPAARAAAWGRHRLRRGPGRMPGRCLPADRPVRKPDRQRCECQLRVLVAARGHHLRHPRGPPDVRGHAPRRAGRDALGVASTEGAFAPVRGCRGTGVGADEGAPVVQDLVEDPEQ